VVALGRNFGDGSRSEERRYLTHLVDALDTFDDDGFEKKIGLRRERKRCAEWRTETLKGRNPGRQATTESTGPKVEGRKGESLIRC
jgi:hypothetical protein